MPHVIVKMYAGRSEEEKQALAAELAKALMTTLGSAEKSISVSIEDVAREDWVEQVYVPEITEKPGILYKKPGYDPFA